MAAKKKGSAAKPKGALGIIIAAGPMAQKGKAAMEAGPMPNGAPQDMKMAAMEKAAAKKRHMMANMPPPGMGMGMGMMGGGNASQPAKKSKKKGK